MGRITFIGDDVAAAGWRLAGVATRACEPGQEAQALAGALAESDLVLVSAEAAARMGEVPLRAALRQLAPITLVAPDLRDAVPYPDMTARMRRQLGIES